MERLREIYSSLLPEIPVFRNLPKCKTKFDPFKTATFHLEPENITEAIPDDVAIALDYAGGKASSKIIQKYSWIKTRKHAMDHVRGGIRAMKRSFFVHIQAEGNKGENFAATDQKGGNLIRNFGEAQNEPLLEDKAIIEG